VTVTGEDGRASPLTEGWDQPDPPNGSAVAPVYSRWRASAVTFGPVGRLVATSLVLLPVVYGIFVNAMFLLAAALWIFLLPTALRDIWIGVRTGDELPLRIADLDRPVRSDVDKIANRKTSTRW
jgi:hypothetical protein